jgi:hypothetical protein
MRVMLASRVRSSRLRSLGVVVGACHRSGSRAAVSASWAGSGSRGQFGELGGPGGFCLGEFGEPGFPPGFQGPGDEPVFRLAGQEGAFGPVSVVAGALGGQLGGPGGPLAAGGDLAGGGDGQLQLGGGDRGVQRPGDGGVDGGGAGVLAASGGLPVRAGPAGVVGAAVVVVADAHVPAAAAVDDALA